MKGFAQNTPFPQRPLIWASPPPAGAGGDSVIAPPGPGLPPATDGQSNIWQSITPVSFAFSYNDGSINVAFPSAKRVAELPFLTPSGIVSVELATSMVNATSDGVLAVFVAKDVGDKISISQNGNLYVAHLVEAGLSHSMRSGMAFADDIAPKIGSNEKISVYVSSSGTGSAANRASGVVTIRYFQNT